MKNDKAESEMKVKEEQFLHGIGVSSEIAIGTAHVIQSGLGQLPEYNIVESDIKNEQKRFRTAVSRAQKQITRLKAKTNKLSDATADELRLLLDAHAAMLTSKRMVIGIETVIEERRINAESAVQTVVHEIAKGFTQVKDPFLSARLQDINDVGSRILRQLMQTPYQAFSQIPEGAVLISEELSPADTALIDPTKIAGFVTQQGGSESHTAIMARSMNLPAILGTQNLLTTIRSGQTLVVDGENGKIILEIIHKNDFLAITVTDNGSGINAKELAYIFDARFRASNALGKNNQHAGLGLAICKRLCQLLNGELTVESELGNGCKFSLQIRAGLR